MTMTMYRHKTQFLSTPSARRATRSREQRQGVAKYFYPRPPRGGRPLPFDLVFVCLHISIHALREEGDSKTTPRHRRHSRFLSTPSARRATWFHTPSMMVTLISIHALREEGDTATSWRRSPSSNFYPRPPRGGRPPPSKNGQTGGYFYPRPPRGGRPSARDAQQTGMIFLSTPSARRATAKTETKSLFSNKLYNILHEFRRALIYNGSKSYPNHAK